MNKSLIDINNISNILVNYLTKVYNINKEEALSIINSNNKEFNKSISNWMQFTIAIKVGHEIMKILKEEFYQ